MIVARIRARSQEAERRWKVRRDVSIATSARQTSNLRAEDGYSALIRNLSENGMLIETHAPLGPRDAFEIALPDHGECVAEVVWVKGELKGCRFFTPIPQAVVSAAVLRSPAEGAAQDIYDELRHVRMALDHEEQRHMPSALSIPGLVLLLVFEVLVVAMLIAGSA
ncbi:hypothetical protein EKN06_01025 [Croceicoccus ponticola]|uniref:PilZ domain-containing protein n=1 Tax=Croceicoccus ponticola TaxID=2217664 RepID=A0A437GZW5_9SPHN|nr:PilZ domain-containing protein [Croceicoccus ponticola]RVQ68843.1 hypothetical protein EKN06_01025 [Croceicoccus ponticola]